MDNDGDMIVESHMAKKALGILDSLAEIKYIVAGNFAEYTEFLNREIEKGKGTYNRYRYVFVDVNEGGILAKAEKIQGYFVGTWANRPDIEAIKRIIDQKKDIERGEELERELQAAIDLEYKITLEESRYG